MPGIGTIRIDLVANTVQFVAGLQGAQRALERFGTQTLNSISATDRAFSSFGTKLTAKVTAPLVALGVAAYKAADPTKKLSNEVQNLGLRSQAALRPLGNVLADILYKANPTIYRAIGFVNALTESFERMDPKAQRTALTIAGIAAAVGPTLLALSALTSATKFAAEGIGAMYGAAKLLVGISPTVISVLAGMALGALAVAAGFDFGERIYNTFQFVQTGLARFISYNQSAAENVRYAWVFAVESVEVAWSGVMNRLAKSASGPLASFLEAAGNPSAAMALRVASVAPAGGDSFAQMSARVGEQHSRNIAEIDAALAVQIAQIRADFAGRAAGGGSPQTTVEQIIARIMTLGDSIKAAFDPAASAFDRIANRAQEIAAADPPIMSPEQLRLIQEHLQGVLAYQEKIFEQAKSTRAEVYPAEVFAADMARLRDVRAAFPTILNDEVFAEKAKRIRDRLVEVEAANGKLWARMELAVRGFADGAGDWFAQLVLDGKASFKEILRDWTATLLAMVSKTLVFQPLANAIGAGVGNLLGGPSTTTGFNNATSLGARGTTLSALGNVFSDGRLLPFAAGGIVGAPTLFPMARGGMGLMGEAGPEGIMPLERVGGKLGVNATGGVVVNVIDQRGSGAQPEVSQSRGPDGRQILRILIRDEVNGGLSSGSFDASLNRNFGVSRQPVRR